MRNEEYELLLSKLADIRDNHFTEEDMEAEGHGMEDSVGCPYAVACYTESKLKRQSEKIEHQATQIDLLIQVIENVETLAENINDIYVSDYIKKFKDEVIGNATHE